MPTAVTETAVRDLIIGAVEAGHHTARQISAALDRSLDETIREIEFLEDLEIYRVDPPESPVTSWWRKRPKGRIVKDPEGFLIEQPLVVRETTVETRIVEKPILVERPENPSEDYLDEIPVSLLTENPLNPRGSVNTTEVAFEMLVASIREAGIQEPLIVTPAEGNFRIVAGHRRFAAAKSAGLEFVPCVVRRFESTEIEEAVMLIENIQRKDLSPMQEANAFRRRWLALNKDIHAVARETGLTQSYVVNRMRLLKLDISIQRLVDERKLSPSNAGILSQIAVAEQVKLLPRALKMKSSELKSYVDRIKAGTLPATRQRTRKTRMTTDKERFTRSWALAKMSAVGDAYFPATHFKNAFDDVCQDACVESGDETMCESCPVPRFIASVLRHRERSEQL